MVFSTFQFVITTALAAISVTAINASGGEVPVLALIVPGLWFFQSINLRGVLLILALASYGLTLPHQPVSLSVAVWTLLPLFMVVFSPRSSIGVILTTLLIVVTLEVGIMLTQSSGKLGGSAEATLVQTLTMAVIWWSTFHWTPGNRSNWWALALLVPLWAAGYGAAALLGVSLVGIMTSVASLSQRKELEWSKLLCWTLPAVAFMALAVNPYSEVPSTVFVVWICLLTTAWMTDYVLACAKENQEIK
ncbi:hypothetical protein [Vibrio sp.]|uniref:hypothetical protein n=1 Tax=Vibrio sp. TaxID=678 RepID=UPI003D1384D7